jgi:ankyrin repeat protein
MVLSFLRDFNGFTPLLLDARLGACELAHSIAGRPGVDPRVADADGQTLTHLAAAQ